MAECLNRPFPNFNDVSYFEIGNEVKRNERLACDLRKVNTQTLFKSNTFQMNFKFTNIYLCFSKNIRIRLFKKNLLCGTK